MVETTSLGLGLFLRVPSLKPVFYSLQRVRLNQGQSESSDWDQSFWSTTTKTKSKLFLRTFTETRLVGFQGPNSQCSLKEIPKFLQNFRLQYHQCCQKVCAKSSQILENPKRPTSKHFEKPKIYTSKLFQKAKISTSKHKDIEPKPVFAKF